MNTEKEVSRLYDVQSTIPLGLEYPRINLPRPGQVGRFSLTNAEVAFLRKNIPNIRIIAAVEPRRELLAEVSKPSEPVGLPLEEEQLTEQPEKETSESETPESDSDSETSGSSTESIVQPEVPSPDEHSKGTEESITAPVKPQDNSEELPKEEKKKPGPKARRQAE